jgi:hypothetical protein
MSSRPLRLLILVLCFVASGDARARISYLGPGRTPDGAVIDDSERGVREIRNGDVLPEVGELLEIHEQEIIFERFLSDEERARWRAAGGIVPDVQRLRLYRRSASEEDSPTAPDGAATITNN